MLIPLIITKKGNHPKRAVYCDKKIAGLDLELGQHVDGNMVTAYHRRGGGGLHYDGTGHAAVGPAAEDGAPHHLHPHPGGVTVEDAGGVHTYLLVIVKVDIRGSVNCEKSVSTLFQILPKGL